MKFLFLFFGFFFPPYQIKAQVDVANLDFEKINENTRSYSSWNATYFSNLHYRITLDSSNVQTGKYSLRIEYDSVGENLSSGEILNTIPFDVSGKKIRFSGYAKTLNSSDSGYVIFLVSQNRARTKIASKGFRIKAGPDWSYYNYEFNLDTFKLPIYSVVISAYLKNNSAMWIDNFSIYVDDKEISTIEPMTSRANEVTKPLTSQQYSNLETLCRVWGFLKYNHPVVAKGQFNWDMELFKMIPLVKQSSSKEELSQVLLHWIESLGEISPCSNCTSKIRENINSSNLDEGWMKNDRLISKSLQNKLEYVLANHHKGDGYYAIYGVAKNINAINENEFNWRGIVFPNELFRLQLLFRYWNTVEYFYPYKNTGGITWGKILKHFLPLFAEASDTISYQLAVSKLIHSINDTHSGFFNLTLANEFAKLFLPVQTKVINNEAVVYKSLNDSLAKLNDLKPGDIITQINHKSVKQIISERIDWVNGSNYVAKLRALGDFNFLTGGKDSIITITYRRNDKTHLSVVHCYPFAELNYNSKQDGIKWKIIENNIGYVNMGQLEKKDVDSMMHQLIDTKGIIFDLRFYPKGVIRKLCDYLYDDSIAFAQIMYPNLDYPGTFLMDKVTKYWPDPANNMRFHYKGKIILLVNENTQSHGEWTAMVLQALPKTITIGSQTAGADGNTSQLNLSGNYLVNMTGLGVSYPDGKPTQHVGVKIDITVKQSAKGIKTGRDELLEKAIKIVGN